MSLFTQRETSQLSLEKGGVYILLKCSHVGQSENLLSNKKNYNRGKIINKYSKTQLTYKEFEYKTKYYKLVLATTLFCNLTVNISLFLMYGCYESRGGDLH